MNSFILKIPFLSLCLLAISLPVSKAAASICFGLALATMLFKKWHLKEPLISQFYTKYFGAVFKAMLIFMFYCSISLLWGNYLWTNLEGLSKFGRNFLLLWLVLESCESISNVYTLVGSLMLGGVLTSINGFIQCLIGVDLIKHNSVTHGRMVSNFESPTTLFAYLALIFPLSFIYILDFSKRIPMKISGICAALILALALYWSLTRNTFFFLLITSLGLILITSRIKPTIKVLCILVSLLSILYLQIPGQKQTNLYRLLSNLPNSTSVYERLHLWKISLKMIHDRPLLGHGLNSYSRINEIYFPPREDVLQFLRYLHLAYPHNGYLKIWVECGFIGLILYLLIYVQLLKQIWALKNRRGLIFYLISILTFMGSCSFDTFLESTTTRLYFGLSLG